MYSCAGGGAAVWSNKAHRGGEFTQVLFEHGGDCLVSLVGLGLTISHNWLIHNLCKALGCDRVKLQECSELHKIHEILIKRVCLARGTDRDRKGLWLWLSFRCWLWISPLPGVSPHNLLQLASLKTFGAREIKEERGEVTAPRRKGSPFHQIPRIER